jgi:hypothetical protein
LSLKQKNKTMNKKFHFSVKTLMCLIAFVLVSVSNAQITNYTPTIAPTSICGTGSATITLSGSQNTVTYGVVASTNTTVLAAGPTTGTGGPINFTIPSVSVTTTYAVVGIIVGTATTVMNPYATILVNPLPVVGIAPSATAICSGQSDILTASGASTYTWMPGDSIGASIPFTPTVSTTYTVTGATANGCTATATQSITVNALPTITIGGGGGGGICPGASATLTAGGGVTYTWSPGGATTASVVVSPTVTTTYTLTGSGADGCDGTKTKTVTVKPTATVTISGPPFICNGSAGTLTASIGGGPATYTWNTAATTAAITVSPTVTTTYSVTAASSGGPGGCPGTASYTLNVTPNPPPTVTISGSTVTCSGSADLLTAGGAATYTWNTGATTATISPTPTVNTTYTVTGTDASGCTNTATLSITANPLPHVTVNNPVICAGGTTTLTATGANTYTWSTSATTASITVSPTITTSYSVAGTSTVTGCTSAQAVGTVTVNALPTLTVTPATICPTATATLTANPSTETSYTWSAGLTPAGSSATGSPTVTTTYTVSATNSNGCIGSTTAQIVVVSNLTVTATPSSSVTCAGNSVTLTGLGASSYSWTSSGGTMSGGTGTTVTVTPGSPSTTYTVNGSSGTCTATPYVLTVNVNALPTYSLSANAYTVCAGSPQVLNVSGANTYTWTPAATLNNPNIANPTASPTVTTTYSVTGTNASGCTNHTAATVTVTANALPTITITGGPPFGGICPGTTETLTASGGTTYTWATSGATTTTVAVTPTITTTYSVTGTNTVTGCSNTGTKALTVNAAPTVTVSAPTSICIGQTATLTAVPTSSVAIASYAWSTGGTSASTTSTPTTTTNYTVVATGTGFPTGCTDTVRLSVTVNALPVITASASPSNTVCSGSSVTLNGGGASTYTWTGGVTNGTAFTTTVNATYTVTGTDANGCMNTATEAISVNALPVVTIDGLTSASATVCAGTVGTATASGAITYTWMPGNTHSTTLSGTIHSSVTFTLTGTDANGCVNMATEAITANPNPTLTVTPQTICPTSTATLVANPTTLASYTWTPGLSSTSGATVTGSPTVTTSYTVTATGADGCITMQTTSIAVVSSLTVTAVSSANAVCGAGSSITLTGLGASSYTWASSDGSVDGMTGSNITATPVGSSTTYSVGGSSGSCTAPIFTLSVIVNSLPSVTAIASPSTTICSGSSVTLNGSGAGSYVWTGGVTNGTAFSPTVTATYSVTGTDANNCSDTASVQVVVNSCSTGIDNVINSTLVNVYPNPTSGTLFVKLDNTENTSVEVYNTLGQLVFSKTIVAATESINLENLNQGVYTVFVKQNNIYIHHSNIILNK